MLIKKPADIDCSEITPEEIYLDRRSFVGQAAAFGAVATMGAAVPWVGSGVGTGAQDDEELTSFEHVTGYNNFYEFGTDKDDPAKNAVRASSYSKHHPQPARTTSLPISRTSATSRTTNSRRG